MQLITLDFESTYSMEYSLSKMTTEAYVRDGRFEAILCGFKVNDGPSFFIEGPRLREYLPQLKLEENAVVMHHAHFDALILSHHYGIRPRAIIDTLGMARALYGANGRISLAKLCEREGIGAKGDEVLKVQGMRYADFDYQALHRYGQYCKNDVDRTYDLALRYMPQFSREELEINDYVIRMFTEPTLRLDVDLLTKYAAQLKIDKATLMLRAGANRDDLMSNPKFAQLLIELGIEPPMKVSPAWLKKPAQERTGDGLVYSFAKTDPGMQALAEHPDENVQALVAARTGVKSTLAETRAQRMIAMAGNGAACLYLKYSGASGSHRLSGGDKMNWQNMTRGGVLRDALMAQDGQVVVVGDSSNIEARILDCLAGQEDMVEVYRKADRKEGPDMYCTIAERIYKRPTTKQHDPFERQMGKVCVAEGTRVLCYDGWKPIEQVADGDRVWDGEEWVWAQGSVCNGLRPTLQLCGIWLTPDHQVWSGTQWWDAQSLVVDEKTRSQSLGFAAASLQSLGISKAPDAEESPHSLCSASADAPSTPSMYKTLRSSRLHGAIFARCVLVPAPANHTGGTRTWFPMMITVNVCSTDYPQRSLDATALRPKTSRTTGVAASSWLRRGATTEPRFFDTLLRCLGGTTPSSTWTAKITTGGTCPATFGSSVAARTPKTSARSEKCRTESPNLRRNLRVYDVINCGPRNRFTVLTADGPLVVHNCKLGLGFGMGHEKFRATVRAQAKDPDGKPLVITPKFAAEVVDIYRDAHPQVRKLWKRGEAALKSISQGILDVGVDYQGIVRTCKDGIIMPGGLRILFPDLRFDKDEQCPVNRHYGEWSFWNGKTREHIYGAKFIENIVQCLARIIVFEQCRVTAKQTKGLAKWVHSVHDEGIFVADVFDAPYVLETLTNNMRKAPDWFPNLPLNSEGGFHQRYGKAKQ